MIKDREVGVGESPEPSAARGQAAAGVMVGSAAHAAAVEERRKKLQEYLAAKGKLKCPNTKPYLKDQKLYSKPPTSRSTIRPKNDTFKWTHSCAAERSTGNVLQPGSSNVNGTQRPKPAAPKILGKGPITGSLSSKPDCKLSRNTHICQLQKIASSAVYKPVRRSVPSHETQCLRRFTEQKTTNRRLGGWMDPAAEGHAESQSLGDFPKETDKENCPLPNLVELKRKPETELCSTAKSKENSDCPSKRGLAPKQAVHQGAENSVLLKDQVNKPFVHRIQVWVPTGECQQIPEGTSCKRPRDKHQRTVPSHLVQSLARIRESRRLLIKKENAKVNENEKEGRSGAKLQENAINKQTVERSLPRTNPMVPQIAKFNRHDNGKPDLKLVQPFPERKPSVMAPPLRTVTRQTQLVGGTPKIHPYGPPAKLSYSLKKEPQPVDSKAKGTVPWNCSVRALNPKAQPQNVTQTKPTTSEEGVREPILPDASVPQIKPNVQRKKSEEDRRKKLEEWLASKGKTYKRPPMKLLAQNQNVQKLNVSFWKSIKEEEENKKTELDLSNKIKNTLAECLKLVEEGARSDEILAILSGFPEAEKFATFWICKVKLLESQDSSDVIALYEAAVRCGAEPIQELRDVVLSVLKSAKKTEEVPPESTSATNATSVKETAKEETAQEPDLPIPRERVQVGATPQIAKKYKDNHLMPCIKLQITPLPRTPGMLEKQSVKLVTPVRRSLRIEHARPTYPEALQEHGTVVASLDQLPRVTETSCFIYCKNEALPEETELQILGAS
ncbi:cytoskeleton-associated protein 2-like isoform X1 [Sminthopsis crassicaudata]|uniref:cytoskeleton-associated protein 2-like isoform X1 n=2 Tax=Sminthopsis crassicaudata TaxID=9301 RepID=UPI003D6945B4